MDTFGIIDTMLARPYLFTGGESLSALRYFLGGYNFCRMEKGEFDGSEARLQTMCPTMENSSLIDIYMDSVYSIHYKGANINREAKLAMDKEDE